MYTLAPRDNNKYSDVSPYGYLPDAWIGILFVILFALSTICHFVQAGYYRLWFLFPTAVLAGCIEIIGWAGRLWSSYNVLLNSPYLMQIVCTIIAPTPLVAASFVILGEIIRRLGQQYSRLSAKWYTIIFCSCDIVALIVQAIGVGLQLELSALTKIQHLALFAQGGNIMLAGIVIQLAAVTFYMLLASEFVLRVLYDKPLRGRENIPTGHRLDNNIKQMLSALTFSSLCIYVRSWYRTIELAGGWTGKIIQTQRYFVIMDALMIVFAMWITNICHPGRFLGPGKEWNAELPMREAGATSELQEQDPWSLKDKAAKQAGKA